MQADWKRIATTVLVLILGVAVGFLVILHKDLTSIHHDLLKLMTAVSQMSTNISG